jgi:hypothetical protein
MKVAVSARGKAKFMKNQCLLLLKLNLPLKAVLSLKKIKYKKLFF